MNVTKLNKERTYSNAVDQTYRTRPDENHPRKMKPMAKKKREDLENTIADFYLQQERSELEKTLNFSPKEECKKV